MFKFFLPTKIIFGCGSINNLHNDVKPLGKKCLIVCGKSSLKENGLLKKITENLSRNDIEYDLYEGISQEPTTELVYKGLEILNKNKFDFVVGVGGGSVIDVAKATAGLYGEFSYNKNFKVEDYLEIDGTKRVEIPGIPFVSVPTVAGTGAEVTMNAVILNPLSGKKRSIRSEYLFAKLAIIDPLTTITLPKTISSTAAVDALCHLVEGFISKKSSPLCDHFAIEGIKYIIENLPLVIKNPSDISAREKISIASLYGGIMIVNSGLTLAHGIAAVVGAKYKIPHGVACSVVLPEVLEWSLEFIPQQKILTIKNLFSENPKMFLYNFYTKIGLNTKLNISNDFNFEKLAEEILNTSSTKGSPKEPTLQEIITILKQIINT